MYRDTLIEQKKILEEKQKECSGSDIDISEVIELSKSIIALAKKIDELDRAKEITIALNSKPIETNCNLQASCKPPV